MKYLAAYVVILFFIWAALNAAGTVWSIPLAALVIAVAAVMLYLDARDPRK